MRSLDLFSGIGGFTLGLRDVCHPVAYCEIDPAAQRILRDRMDDGRLPRAPICPDVATLSAKEVGDIDILLAGFPCQGFSLMGRRTGYAHGASSLFSHVVRLVAELRPPLFLLENVPEFVTKGMDRLVDSLGTEQGYELRWMILGACHLGAPHMRRRWFCLGIRNDDAARAVLERSQGDCPPPYPWGNTTPPVIMTLSVDAMRRTRCAALGNAVVPDCVRQAFHHLRQVQGTTAWRRKRAWPMCGRWHEGEVTAWQPKLPVVRPTGLDLTFDPTVYVSDKPRSKLQSAVPVRVPVRGCRWMTPRHGNVSAANYLSHRSLRDLPSQVRFERGTPDELRTGQISPEFVEYLMGFPLGWTAPTSGM